jgi:hypothetical protein
MVLQIVEILTEEEHNAFFTTGAGEGKNQIRRIYYHLVSMCFFIFAGYLLVFLIFLNSLCNWPYGCFASTLCYKMIKNELLLR